MWKLYTQDPWILETVSGYKIEFEQFPFQKHIPREIPFPEDQKIIVCNEVHNLLQKGAIVPSKDEANQFISTIFIVPKPNGKFRPIINLRYLNQFVKYEHFKQETFKVVLDLVQEGDFFTSIDLQDAYFSVPIHPDYQKFLKFSFDGQLLMFRCLPFGLASAPRCFTKILKPIFAYFRFQNIRCSYFIDDSINMNNSFVLCKENCMTILTVLESLGFVVNRKKSSFIPSQRMIFFGFILDSVKFMVFLTEEKVLKIIQSAELLLSQKVKVREIASFIGRIINAFFAILEAPLFYRSLERDKIKGLGEHMNYENFMVLSQDSVLELQWWIDNINLKNGKRIRPDKVTMHCCTDASLLGWGSHILEDGRHAQGRWNETEAQYSINFLELLAVFYSLQALCKNSRNIHIEIQTDNVSCMSYIVDMGGMASFQMDKLAKQIWSWCLRRNIFLSAVHLPGKSNVKADFYSRNFSDSTEWMLKKEIFSRLCKHFFLPDIDLFASRLNKQLDNFVSWFPEPGCFGSDAFSLCWSEFSPFIFPPFSLVGKVVNKIIVDNVDRALLLIPNWKSQTWYPLVLSSIISFPVRLPRHRDLLVLPHNLQEHPLNRSMTIVAVMVSGKHSRVKEFQTELQELSCRHGDLEHSNSMGWHGTTGIFGVVKDFSIPFKPLKQ